MSKRIKTLSIDEVRQTVAKSLNVKSSQVKFMVQNKHFVGVYVFEEGTNF